MARIIVATYMVRYPLGGMLSWALQWPLGFSRLGHDVLIVERATYHDACFNPLTNMMSDDGEYGFQVVSRLLQRFGLGGCLIFVDCNEKCFGASQAKLHEEFRSADLLVDIGNHGAWQNEARSAGIPTVLVDGEPGFTQIKMEHAIARGENVDRFDFYFSNGANIGTSKSTAPDAGLKWQHVFSPVVTEIFPAHKPPGSNAFSTVMNWKSHEPLNYNNKQYGQKDAEFEKFINLPNLVESNIEIAAAGSIPIEQLRHYGWVVKDAHKITASFDSYVSYIGQSLGEFSVCKNIFVETHTGWFSDRSAAYLACGRPVVLQDTGFSDYLPCGQGLFAVNSVEEAAVAITEIEKDYNYHSAKAKETAKEHLDATIVLARFLTDIGLY